MTNKLMEHPAVKIACESFARFRAKTLDIAGLQENLAAAASLLDGALPKPVRDSVEWAENEIEGIQFTVSSPKRPDEVDRVWREVEEVLARHAGIDASELD